MRFLLLDRIYDINLGQSIKGVKCWSLTDEIFLDHFPGFPIVPGVLLIESMAQLSGLLIEESAEPENENGKRDIFGILSIVHNAKFHKFVVPGDKCEIEATLTVLDTLRAATQVETRVDGELVAKAELSFIITRVNDSQRQFAPRREEYIHILKQDHSRKK